MSWLTQGDSGPDYVFVNSVQMLIRTLSIQSQIQNGEIQELNFIKDAMGK